MVGNRLRLFSQRTVNIASSGVNGRDASMLICLKDGKEVGHGKVFMDGSQRTGCHFLSRQPRVKLGVINWRWAIDERKVGNATMSADVKAWNRAGRPRRKDSWAVTVERNGEQVVTIASNMLSCRDLSAEDEQAIRDAARHLLSFVGEPKNTEFP